MINKSCDTCGNQDSPCCRLCKYDLRGANGDNWTPKEQTASETRIKPVCQVCDKPLRLKPDGYTVITCDCILKDIEKIETKNANLEVVNKELKDRCERYVWNLGGISTLLLGYNVDEFNQDYALPALKETNEYVKKHKELEKENDRLKNAQHEHFEQIVTALEMKNRELVTENEELKTMVNRNAGDAIYHQAEKIKLQDINATLKAQLDEAGEIIGGLLGTAKGYELEHRKDKLYTVRQRIERGDQFLAKLDLLEGEK
jgi:membrane-associated HD superfamily phosphohydrolase